MCSSVLKVSLNSASTTYNQAADDMPTEHMNNDPFLYDWLHAVQLVHLTLMKCMNVWGINVLRDHTQSISGGLDDVTAGWYCMHTYGHGSVPKSSAKKHS